MPQVWVAIFFILLAAVELYQSVKDIALPFPVYLVLGAVLAVASNYQQPLGFSQNQAVTLSEVKPTIPVLTTTQTPLLNGAENSDAPNS